jgi:uncharacterized protein YdhG (YjbR/CyaY superfamily)
MKKANSSTRGANEKSVDDYLAGVPEPARRTLQRVGTAIRSPMPAEATEAISYGSNHCSLFPGASVIKALKNELKGFETSKGTIHFPVDQASAGRPEKNGKGAAR